MRKRSLLLAKSELRNLSYKQVYKIKSKSLKALLLIPICN